VIKVSDSVTSWSGVNDQVNVFVFRDLLLSDIEDFTICAVRMVLFSVVTVCVFVCLSEPLEISSRTF